MKKLLLVLLVITLAVSLLIGCNQVIPDEGEGKGKGKIAFISHRDEGSGEIYVMNADGSNQTRLTNNLAYDVDPCFSPDGTKIAFTSKRDGDLEIYIMNADGSNRTRLTNNPAGDWDPCFSPDGTKIAFLSGRFDNPEIYVMNTDGSNRTRLTYTFFAAEYSPCFSPDGTKIAFGSDRGYNRYKYESEIYVMNADGSKQTNITNYPNGDYSPSWGPYDNGIGSVALTGTYAVNPTTTTTYKPTATNSAGSVTATCDVAVNPAVVAVAVGDSYGGGIIAYIFQSGDPGYDANVQHGLIAATADQSAGIHWYNGSYVVTGALGIAIGTGQANTTAIVDIQGAGSYAAQLCNDLTAGGYNDWFLPSKDELDKLYTNKVAIGGFANDNDWSSSEYSAYDAWDQIFDYGYQYYYSKASIYRVRAVRAF